MGIERRIATNQQSDIARRDLTANLHIGNGKPLMNIFLDIDDTITYQPKFFSRLTHSFNDAQITVVTFRTDFESADACLKELYIRYDKLIVSTDPELGRKTDESLHQWKAGLVNRMKPDLFFEDMPEVVSLIDEDIAVFQPCDGIIRLWMRSQMRSAT